MSREDLISNITNVINGLSDKQIDNMDLYKAYERMCEALERQLPDADDDDFDDDDE